MSGRRGTQAASGLGRDRGETVRGTQTDSGETQDRKMHTQMTETSSYGDKREIVTGCYQKIVRGTQTAVREDRRVSERDTDSKQRRRIGDGPVCRATWLSRLRTGSVKTGHL